MSELLAKGHIGVDARRAVAKLREHLLVDLHAYLLELVRAAVLAGAEDVQVHYDADDLYVRFAASPCAPKEAERLLDYALAYDNDRGRCLRLLAVGVNAALGLRPTFVDVYVLAEDGAPIRFRYDPNRLVEPDEDSALCDRTNGALPPDGRGLVGTCIHVRRRWDWSTLKRAVTGHEPPELGLLRLATYDLPIALVVQDVPMERPPRSRVLLRASSRSRWRTEVELLAAEAPPHLTFLELGVRLATHAWSPWPEASMDHLGPRLSIRGVVDAPDLPTNASRSAVRVDDRQLVSAVRSIEHTLGTTIVQLARHVTEGMSDDIELLTTDQAELNDLWGRIGCVLMHAAWTRPTEGTGAEGLLDVPILRNAVGQSIRPRQVLQWLEDRRTLNLYRADVALPEHNSPIVQQAVWVHAPWVELMFAPLPTEELAERLEAIHRGIIRRTQLLRSPASEPVVSRTDEEIAQTKFHVKDGKSEGLRGELSIRDPFVHKLARLRIFVEDRLIETVELSWDQLAIPIDAAVAWPDRLVPTLAYDGVERNRSFRRLVSRLGKQAVSMIAQLWERVEGQDVPHALRALARLAFVNHPELALRSWLKHVPCFSTTTGAWLSLTQLAEMDRPVRVVPRAGLGLAREAVDGLPVVVFDEDEPGFQAAIAAGHLTAVRYDEGLRRTATHCALATRDKLEASLRAAMLTEGVSDPLLIWFEGPGFRGFVTPGSSRRALRHHLGVLVAQTPRPFGIGVTTVAIDEDSLVPSADWERIEWPRALPRLFDADRHLCDAVLDDLEGKKGKFGDGNLRELVRDYLVAADADLEKLPGLSDGQADEDRERQVRVSRLLSRFSDVRPRPSADRSKATGSWLSMPLRPLAAPLAPPPGLVPPRPEQPGSLALEFPELPRLELPKLEPPLAQPARPLPTDPLEAALVSALVRMAAPRGKVVHRSSGPLLRYDPARSELSVCVEHPVYKMVRRGAADPALSKALAAAAITEINRSLASVTDAEERRAIVDLLRT